MYSSLLIGRAAQYRDLSPGEACVRMGKSTGFGVRAVRFESQLCHLCVF